MGGRGLFTLATLFLVAQVAQAQSSTLYGYYFYNTSTGSTSGLVTIDPSSGASTQVCDLSSFPELKSGSTSSITSSGTLLFYTTSTNKGNTTISIIELDPTSCSTKTLPITGLANGQNEVRDMKYDSTNNVLYMVLPDPFCIHGSLDSVDVATGKVITRLANVIDPVGLDQQSGVDEVGGLYYYIGIPIGFDLAIEYQINQINLKTGNTTSVTLPSNYLGIGNSWESNYTLNFADNLLVGAVSPQNATVKQCFPSGFYSIDVTNGQVACDNGPIDYMVYPLAELDRSSLYYYQLFNDAQNNFYLVTYDPQSKTVVYNTPCKMCSVVSVLAALP